MHAQSIRPRITVLPGRKVTARLAPARTLPTARSRLRSAGGTTRVSARTGADSVQSDLGGDGSTTAESARHCSRQEKCCARFAHAPAHTLSSRHTKACVDIDIYVVDRNPIREPRKVKSDVCVCVCVWTA